VIEPTSGNTGSFLLHGSESVATEYDHCMAGIGLAMACAIKGKIDQGDTRSTTY